MTRPNELPAREAAAAIAARQLTSVELITACLERIDAREKIVGAWAFLDRDRVLADAKARDAEAPRGPLHGVPVGVKDIIDAADHPTEYGSAIYRGYRPRIDAACVAMVRKAGGIVMGKTVTTEFATITPPKTTNPFNPDHTPGGSSSGSAAAVADQHVPVAFGTQTAGSITRPAAFCGVIGFKPSFGAYAMAGIKPLSQSLDTLGTISRTVDDALLMWEVLHGARLPAAPPIPAQIRIGLCRTPLWSQAKPEAHEAWKLAGQKLAEAGLALEEIELPRWFESLIDAQKIVQTYETSRNMVVEYENNRAQLSARITEALAEGWKITPDDYMRARSDILRARQEFSAIAGRCEGIMMPATTGEAPDTDSTGDPLFSRFPTMLHTPAVNLTVTKGPNGLPVGVQFLGGYDTDIALLNVGKRLAEILA